MQWSQLARWGSVLLMSGILSILVNITGAYYHKAWSQNQAGQGSSTTPAPSLIRSEAAFCDKSGCRDKGGIPVFLTEDVFKLLPKWGKSVGIDIPPHEHQAAAGCCKQGSIWNIRCYPVLFDSVESYENFSQWLKSNLS